MTPRNGKPVEVEPGRPTAAWRRALLVANRTPAWNEMIQGLEADGIQCEVVSPAATPDEIVADLQRCNTVLIADLSPDPVRSMTIVSACRHGARLVPIVAVAANPSLELSRRIRLSGVFYLALEPVSLDEMRSALGDAFAWMGRKKPDASMCRAKQRVLIVDDDGDFVASTSALLEGQGYCVSSAATAKEALAKIVAESPDLIVLDVMMEHDCAGYEVNQAIKYGAGFECFRHVPILMVSSIETDPATRFQMAGEVDMVTPTSYMTKPIDLPRFLAEVRTLLGEQPDMATT